MKIKFAKAIAYLEDIDAGQTFRFHDESRKKRYPGIYMMTTYRNFINLETGEEHDTNSIYDSAQRDDKVEILHTELIVR